MYNLAITKEYNKKCITEPPNAITTTSEDHELSEPRLRDFYYADR